MTAPVSDTSSKSRRVLLAGALGGIGAWSVGMLTNVTRSLAQPGDPVLVDGSHSGLGTTRIQSSAGAALMGQATTGGIGVRGVSKAYIGVHGAGNGAYPGVRGPATRVRASEVSAATRPA